MTKKNLIAVYAGDEFGSLVRKYGQDRLGRDREYRDAVHAKMKRRKNSATYTAQRTFKKG